MAVYTTSPTTISTVLCVVCTHGVNPAKATAGSVYADGRPAFACSHHLLRRDAWINAWALFEDREAMTEESTFTERQQA